VLTAICGDLTLTLSWEEATIAHEVFLMGLWEGAECSLRVGGLTSDGRSASYATTIEIGALPDDFPELAVVETDVDDLQPGWTLIDLSNQSLRIPSTAALVDEAGRFRWYHRFAALPTHNGQQLDRVEEGIFAGGFNTTFARLIEWDGTVSWQAEFETHYEGFRLADGRSFIHLRPDEYCENEIKSSPVVIWDMIDNAIRYRWNLCDHYEPPEAIVDWEHLNGLGFFEGGDAFALSARHQNTVFKVDMESGELLWALGFAGRQEEGWNGDFSLAEADRFLEQHAPEVQPNGNILLFDNGSCFACSGGLASRYARGWSRAIEIAYDEESWEAWAVWEFRPDPDIYAKIWGDADRLENGNTLVVFGRHPQTSHIIEVDADGQELWRLNPPAGWGTYRAERTAPYYGAGFEEELNE
jgi:arylsulfate sulfotransferase